jgi:hypothetical protein
MATNPVPPPTPTPPPGSPIPPSPASVLGAADALSASLSYRKLNQADIPKFILDFIIHLQLNVKELKDLNARSAAVRTNAYNKVQNLAKKDSTLALLLLKDKRLTQIAGPIERIKVLQALSDACMIYMDRYLPVVEQVPKTKLISQKIARDLYFHLVKRLPEFYRNIQQATSQTEADEAYSDALLYIQNTAVRPLNRFISTLLGEPILIKSSFFQRKKRIYEGLSWSLKLVDQYTKRSGLFYVTKRLQLYLTLT